MTTVSPLDLRSPMTISLDVPEFEPHPLLRGGHVQTIAGRASVSRMVATPWMRGVARLIEGE